MERLLRATMNTWHGLRAAARSEEAFRLELIAVVLAVPVAFLLAEEAWKRLALIAVVAFVLVVELLNTAIENSNWNEQAIADRSLTFRSEKLIAGKG